ncbi:MAG: methyl-accepting chemotaxis protein [bacterium]
MNRLRGGDGFFGWFRNMRLKTKLLLSVTLLIILITVSILVAVGRVINENMLANKQNTVKQTIASVEYLIEERISSLKQSVLFATQGRDFLDAINHASASGEYKKLGDQALTLQKEMHVERILVCRPVNGVTCKLMASTTDEKRPGDVIPTHRLCMESEVKGIASEFLVEEGGFSIKVCRQIKKGDGTLAFVVVDDVIGADLVHKIEAATGAEVAFLMHRGPNAGRVIASAHQRLVGTEISGEAFSTMQATHSVTYRSNFVDEGEVHMAAFKPILGRGNEVIGSLMILVHMDDVFDMKGNTVKAMSSIGLIAVVLGILAVILLVRGMINPLRQILSIAQAMGKGDLTQRITVEGEDEVGQLAQTFRQMQENLLIMVRQMKSGIELLESSSVELSTSSREQADGSMQQSSALTETSTTVEELAATSKQIAENAQQVADLARQSLTGMENIRNNTDQEANRILTLGEKSQTIGEVVAMIDDIAKQTNILALNASIEAERAGDAGKGFAVVAIEIRELANNVAKSTKQIREIIKEIQDATNASVMATENVGKSVEEGIDLSKRAADSANQISMATQQQGSATSQVVTAIKQMSDIVGQTTAGANQIADTAHMLVELTTEQKRLIEQFIIN